MSIVLLRSVRMFFFFQAEDGIRDLTVTGVQTCALPISGDERKPGESLDTPKHFGRRSLGGPSSRTARNKCSCQNTIHLPASGCRRRLTAGRSEERRVGKECRTRGSE